MNFENKPLSKKRIARGIAASLAMILILNLWLGAGPSGSSVASQGPPNPSLVSGPTAKGHARAIILFIGDGMGPVHRTAGRWAAVGMGGKLFMDNMPVSGWARTASANSAVTDSAAAATAIATGVKTDNGKIAMDPSGQPLETILEQAKARGMAVGLVTTTQIAHATPAAFAAHVISRGNMVEIARQMIALGVDVLLGGGEDEFLPTTVTGCYPEPGERTDGRNLIAEAIAAGYTYVCNEADLAAVNPAATTRLLGLFADEGMVRPFSPPLHQMTRKAIEILSRDPDGFFLMVEGGQIDWASHANDATNAITDTIGLDWSVAVAQAYAASTSDVLIIVTADHETGGMQVDLTAGDQGPFYMPDGTPFYVSWSTTGHTGVDVPTTAQGPWAYMLSGTYENTHIYQVMRKALDWQVWLPSLLTGG